MARLVTLVVLALALTANLAEARSKRIHVTAEVMQATFMGFPQFRSKKQRSVVTICHYMD